MSFVPELNPTEVVVPTARLYELTEAAGAIRRAVELTEASPTVEVRRIPLQRLASALDQLSEDCDAAGFQLMAGRRLKPGEGPVKETSAKQLARLGAWLFSQNVALDDGESIVDAAIRTLVARQSA